MLKTVAPWRWKCPLSLVLSRMTLKQSDVPRNQCKSYWGWQSSQVMQGRQRPCFLELHIEVMQGWSDESSCIWKYLNNNWSRRSTRPPGCSPHTANAYLPEALQCLASSGVFFLIITYNDLQVSVPVSPYWKVSCTLSHKIASPLLHLLFSALTIIYSFICVSLPAAEGKLWEETFCIFYSLL